MVLFLIVIAVVIAAGILISYYINAKSSKKNTNGIIVMALAGAWAFFLILFWTIFNSFAVYLTFVVLLAALLLIVYFFMQMIANNNYFKRKAVLETEPNIRGTAKKLPEPRKMQHPHTAGGYKVQAYLDLMDVKESRAQNIGQPGMGFDNASIPDSISSSKAPEAHTKVSRKHVRLEQHVAKKHESPELLKTETYTELQETQEPIVFKEQDNSQKALEEPKTILNAEEEIVLTEDEETGAPDEAAKAMNGNLTEDAFEKGADETIMPPATMESEPENMMEYQTIDTSLDTRSLEEEKLYEDKENLNDEFKKMQEKESEDFADVLVDTAQEEDIKIKETALRENAILSKAELFMSQGRYLIAFDLYQNCAQNADGNIEIKDLKLKMLECLILAGQFEDASKAVFGILNSKYNLTDSNKQQLKAFMALLDQER